MTYQVLARKWRPQAFESVVGQDAITRTLRNALAGGRIAHAYLFAGPRGVGKTTTARLLARALLCPDRTGPEPCDTCLVCEETRAGTSMDVFEIDAASNRKIDDVRALRENVKYAPSRGRYKVYIIDEAHQLTADAFDALLKTLEEPPPHVIFVLATTDPRELPPTILSRVQRFDFRPIAPEMLIRSLERILGEENVPFEPAALPVIVRAAQGSLRDALSLLDTAIAYGGGRVDAATVATLLGATAPVEVRAFAEALIAHDVDGALAAIDRAATEGEDLQAFARDVIELLRVVMVLKAAPRTQPADLTTTEANELRALGDTVSLDEVLYLVRAFLEADALMRESPHPRVELEIAAVRATRRPVPAALEDLMRRVDEAASQLRHLGPGSAPAAPTQGSLLGAPAPPPSTPRSAPGRGPAGAPSAAMPSRPSTSTGTPDMSAGGPGASTPSGRTSGPRSTESDGYASPARVTAPGADDHGGRSDPQGPGGFPSGGSHADVPAPPPFAPGGPQADTRGGGIESEAPGSRGSDPVGSETLARAGATDAAAPASRGSGSPGDPRSGSTDAAGSRSRVTAPSDRSPETRRGVGGPPGGARGGVAEAPATGRAADAGRGGPAATADPTSGANAARGGAGNPADGSDAAMATAWERVIEDVSANRKPMLAGILMHARPTRRNGSELIVAMTGTSFHRDQLSDRANRDVVLQAIRRNFPGVTEFTLAGDEDSANSGATAHPAVQAAIATFQGEVVAVRPRAPQGEGQ